MPGRTDAPMSASAISGPHRGIARADLREKFLAELLDHLWDRYRERVNWVREYEKVVQRAGATFVNDHIAFRTLAGQAPYGGIASIARLFEALGYRAAGCYQFPDKHLSSIHFQHPNGLFPKLFVSELQTWRMLPASRGLIERTLATHRPALGMDVLADLADLDKVSASRWTELRTEAVRQIHELPWTLSEKADVQALNRDSQFAAWVLVHGYNVNHFTSLINSHGVAALGDIEKTIDALKAAGIPMKAEIEGERGTKLRQTATEAAMMDVAVRDGGRDATMPWTYAYFELAERGEIADPDSGRRGRFEGFLGPQATNLFEMTRVGKS
jgi:hypothetical protein